MAPSCVPASDFESPRGPLGPEDMREILRHPRALGVAEMMNFPGVIAGDAGRAGADGGAARRRPRARASWARRWTPTSRPGSRTDHEAFTAEEALQKRRRGHVGADPRGLQRAQPAHAAGDGARARARLLRVLHRRPRARLPLPRGPHRPDVPDRRRGGHRARGRAGDGLAARRARPPAAGPRRDRARLRRRPRAARRPRHPSRRRWCSRTGACPSIRPRWPAELRDTMRSIPVSFGIPGDARAGAGDRDPARPADHRPRRRDAADPRRRGRRRPGARPGQDRRDRAPPRDRAASASASCAASGCTRGAFASTVAHDAHNLVVVGVDDADMALCAARAQELGGGLVVARGGEVRGELALPIAGLLSDAPAGGGRRRASKACRTCSPSRA